MEFPTLGANCALTNCQSLSFLPFQCSLCHQTFCSAHRLPSDHACSHLQDHNVDIQICNKCQEVIRITSSFTLNEHQENGCTTHLLPIGQSHRVPCDFPECPRVDPVTHTCSGCSSTFCLSHRHQTDHHCSRLQGLLLQKQSENAKREQLRQEIALKHGAQQAPSSSQPPVSKQEKQLAAEKRAQNAKEALALAKARAASRNAASSSSSSSTSSESPASLSSKPKPKTASRYVAVMKLKKSALGEQNISVKSRLYVSVGSPAFSVPDGSAVFLDKSWSIGRALDYIVNLLNLSQAKEISLDAEKRLTIFHAKEAGDIPAALTMQSCLGDLKQIEDGDLFFMAPADWSWA